jgi:mannose-6-phosphate isomerase-like protein (cupin superfamily)
MDIKSINFEEKFAKFTEYWSPKIIAQMNDYHFKLAKIQGEFVWHKHDETDEVFIIIAGEMRIAFRDGGVDLKQGEMVVVPKGVEHKPIAGSECSILVIEPAGTVNTGDAGGDMTVAQVPWI